MAKETVILSIFGFYVFLFILLGFIGTSFQTTQEFGDAESLEITGFLGTLTFFVTNIKFAITGLPGWANTILFLPLGITIAYIIAVAFLPGGGS